MPRLLPTISFFYRNQPRIWVAGGLLPIWNVVAGGVITDTIARYPGQAAPAGAVAGVLRSCEGGIQGNGLSTAITVGRHHEMLSDVQRANRTTDTTGIADDTYYKDGTTAVVRTFDDKRALAWEELKLVSKLPKVVIHSSSGDLSEVRSDIPGSPNHPIDAVRGFKAAGCFFGDDDWCSAKLVDLLKKRLANLDLVDHLTDSDKVPNTRDNRYSNSDAVVHPHCGTIGITISHTLS